MFGFGEAMISIDMVHDLGGWLQWVVIDEGSFCQGYALEQVADWLNEIRII